MNDMVLGWILGNRIELLGALLGIAYIFFSIRQNILTWPTGLITSVLYSFVFFKSKLYADMGLQIYYVVISLYGWYYWLRGKKSEKNNSVPVRKTSRKLWFILTGVSVLIYILLLILLKFTDSDIAYLDALTTSLSLVATWMLARKYLEHWLIWIFVDLVSSGMYVYKNLWPTVVLFLVYTFMAYLGYLEWKKDYNSKN